MNWWIGSFHYLPEIKIWVHIYAKDQNDVSAIKKAHRLFLIIKQNEYQFREYAYSNVNEWSLNEDLSGISRDEFCEKLTLESITFQKSEGSEIAFADGDIFGGHIIVINLDDSGCPTDARIEG